VESLYIDHLHKVHLEEELQGHREGQRMVVAEEGRMVEQHTLEEVGEASSLVVQVVHKEEQHTLVVEVVEVVHKVEQHTLVEVGGASSLVVQVVHKEEQHTLVVEVVVEVVEVVHKVEQHTLVVEEAS